MWAKKTLLRGALLFVMSSSAVPLPAAQNGGTAAEAGAAYDAKDWAKAARLYEALVKEHP